MSSSDKLEKDAERMRSRGFGGYAADRLLRRSDFDSAEPTAKVSPARPVPPASSPDDCDNLNPMDPAIHRKTIACRESKAGLKRGGSVKKVAPKPAVKRPSVKTAAKKVAVKRGRK